MRELPLSRFAGGGSALKFNRVSSFNTTLETDFTNAAIERLFTIAQC